MTKRSILLICFTVIVSGLVLSATPSFAQKKTIKACEEEWRANKAANEAAKITEKDRGEVQGRDRKACGSGSCSSAENRRKETGRPPGG